jgi:hypothetical protein
MLTRRLYHGTRINGTFKPLGLKKDGQGVLLMGDKRGNWFDAIAEHWTFERWFRLLSGSRGVVQSAGLMHEWKAELVSNLC